MSYSAERSELRDKFDTEWADRIPVDWPNIAFDQPSPPAPWCRFRISGGERWRTTFGSHKNNYRNVGLIFIQIFVPVDTGDDEAFQRADEAAEIFRSWGGTNIQCRTPVIKEIGADGSGYYQVNVTIPFSSNELL